MSYASPNRPIVGDQRVQQWITNQEDRGKDYPDVSQFLAKHLAAGRGLSAQVANKYSAGKYPTGSYGPLGGLFNTQSDKLDEKYGRGASANLRALQGGGVNIAKGNVFMGATETDIPRQSSITPYGGEASTPGRKEYSITSLPRWMVQGAAGSAANPSAPAASTGPATLAADPSLLAARNAYDRANTFSSNSSTTSNSNSATSSSSPSVTGPDLTKTGGSLYNEISAAGQRQIDQYQSRFLDNLDQYAILTGLEVGQAGRQAIANLPADLKIPSYDKLFPKQATSKKGIYSWLESRIKNA